MTAIDTLALAVIGAPVLGMIIVGLATEGSAPQRPDDHARFDHYARLIQARRIRRTAEQQLDAITVAALQQMVAVTYERPEPESGLQSGRRGKR